MQVRRDSRCRSWRPDKRWPHQPPHPPGSCRRCWRPCRNRVPPAMVRCDECTSLLLQSPSVQVRLALASEADPNPEVIAVLGADADLLVAGTARWQQDRLVSSAGARAPVVQARASW